MTRKEAVKWLSNLKMDIGKTQHQELWHYEQALDEIIQTLEQEPSCRNTRQVDLISRQAAIDAFDGVKVDEKTEYDIGYNDGIDLAVSKLSVLPSAQPFTSEQIQTMQELESAQVEKAYELGKADRPTGHWIENAQEYYEMINEKGGGVDENTPYFIDDIACSECLAKFSVIDNETERFDFCPNCGSYNGGGEE